jgi:hypothetical protein
VVLAALNKKMSPVLNESVIKHVSENLKNDIDVMNAAIKVYPPNFSYASPQLKDNGDLIMFALSGTNKEEKNKVLDSLNSKNIRFYEKKVVLAIVKVNGLFLKHASITLMNDMDVVKAAVTTTPSSFKYASLDLKDNKEMVKYAIRINAESFEFASADIRGNKEMALLALKSGESSFKYLSENLRDDFSIVILAFARKIINKQIPPNLSYVSERLRKNKKVGLRAVQQDKNNLKFLSEKLRDDTDIIETFKTGKIPPKFKL